jgi:hypothetical protein
MSECPGRLAEMGEGCGGVGETRKLRLRSRLWGLIGGAAIYAAAGVGFVLVVVGALRPE